MCGIVGYAGFFSPGLINRMTDTIKHRGPDDQGHAEFQNHMMAIGMRRLSIIDLEGGKQPFVSADGKVSIVFNGEIYNHNALRQELKAKGHKFYTRSDTEVLLQCYLEWGNDTWNRLYGMFAIAIIDLRDIKPRMLIVRDHVGIKPLYYIEKNSKFLFSSEIKAFLCHEGFSVHVNLPALRDYLALRYVPGPGCLFDGVRKLRPGHMLIWHDGKLKEICWWSPPDSACVDHNMTEDEAVELFGTTMRQTVRDHLISDVPLGAFLSGGIDSNLIVALMAEADPKPVRTFTIGFPEFSNNDQKLATITAEVFGTDHHPIECYAADLMMLPDIAWNLDEPIGDAIVVPMSVLAREARKSVSVVLTGEGADELLGGYMFHRKLVQTVKLKRIMPKATWQLAAYVIEHIPPALLNILFDYPGTLGTDGRRKTASLLRDISTSNLPLLYRNTISLFDGEDICRAAASYELAREGKRSVAIPDMHDSSNGSALQRLILLQYSDWLPDDILMKADKMTMMHSLEGRVPYMDKAVIEVTARIPDRYKMGRRLNKLVLRRFAERILPKELTYTPKRAFYIPLESYMNNPKFMEIMNHTLNLDRVKKRGLFRPEWITALRSAPATAGFLPLKRLFSIIMLELWFEQFCPEASWR